LKDILGSTSLNMVKLVKICLYSLTYLPLHIKATTK